jgi:hypothetical protein
VSPSPSTRSQQQVQSGHIANGILKSGITNQQNGPLVRNSTLNTSNSTITMKEEKDIDEQLLDCVKMKKQLNEAAGTRPTALLLQAMRQVKQTMLTNYVICLHSDNHNSTK